MVRKGPLTGVSIVEFTGIGPVPYGSMVLADLGAKVLRIDRPGGYPAVSPELDFGQMGAASICNRSRNTIRIDLKAERGRDLAMRLISGADALVEGYRPGTMERLGLGPDACLAANPRLAYVRVTGWGQDGPLAKTAGHDLNYIAASGMLSLFARNGAPVPAIPPVIGDMAGGGLFMAIGVLAAVLEARTSGRGQVVDTAILDGTANMLAMFSGLHALGFHEVPAGGNVLDGGRHFYRTYVCSDGKAVTVGAIEPAFRRILLERTGLVGDPDLANPTPENEQECRRKLAGVFASKPQNHWIGIFEDSDGCVAPILDPEEAAELPHNRARRLYRYIDGVLQPAPAPRFQRTPGEISIGPAEASRSDPDALLDWGLDDKEIDDFVRQEILG